MNAFPEGSPPAPASPVATLFLALLALAALILVGYFAFVPRPTGDPANSAITVEQVAPAPTGAGPR